MAQDYFQFKNFKLYQHLSGMKITQDACIFGASIKAPAHAKTALDIGAGTGLLSFFVQQNHPQLQINALEIEESAFLELQNNIENNQTQNISALKVDFNTFKPKHTYDLIFANPPFYANHLSSRDQKRKIAFHQNQLGLEALRDGILRCANNETYVYLLLPEFSMKEFVALAEEKGLYLFKRLNVFTRKKGSLVLRRQVCAFRFQKGKCEELALTVNKDNGKFSDDMWNLTKDFYLYRL